jgi:hypothetical protein
VINLSLVFDCCHVSNFVRFAASDMFDQCRPTRELFVDMWFSKAGGLKVGTAKARARMLKI